jgi:hypothetical protein
MVEMTYLATWNILDPVKAIFQQQHLSAWALIISFSTPFCLAIRLHHGYTVTATTK